MTGPEARAQLEAAVMAVLPDEWTAVPWGGSAPSFPAAVVVGREPYRRQGTFCADIYSLAVILAQPVSTGPEGLNECDVLAPTVVDALTAIDGLVYESTSLGGIPPWGGTEIQGATINLERYV